MANFYKGLSLQPRGKHLITVCMGTACHVRGAQLITDELGRRLEIGPGETTEDLSHTTVWPWGRGNHYLFDLNRDWFTMVR